MSKYTLVKRIGQMPDDVSFQYRFNDNTAFTVGGTEDEAMALFQLFKRDYKSPVREVINSDVILLDGKPCKMELEKVTRTALDGEPMVFHPRYDVLIWMNHRLVHTFTNDIDSFNWSEIQDLYATMKNNIESVLQVDNSIVIAEEFTEPEKE